MTEQKEFDVFLSHNSSDKESIRIIAQKLERGGVKTWLDEGQFVGGAHWKQELYEALDQTKVAFFFLGTNGVGPWQDAEIDYLHNRYISSRRESPRIVPIRLPGASIDNLPSKLNYLKEIQFVTLENLDSYDEISKLLKIFLEIQHKHDVPSVETIKYNPNSGKIERIQKDIETTKKESDGLTRKINVIVERLDNVIDVLEEESLKQRKLKFEKERNSLEEKIKQLEAKLAQL
ncbi:toll/interleukin-1 receptor domain-containing protein [Okeania sp. SIO1I7]|uniref:toll/interleukin-1 receptor domain-containing protein n=1 Tax=Okeania sp. SIO1I7 TaxID=2607772 RepID=UPI0013FC63FF|nr:TIR domain-containing protein [Okeania sp. SIO1I7]NET27961.1 TIR domain-containing protein [Okeania sp. SIO1I7]